MIIMPKYKQVNALHCTVKQQLMSWWWWCAHIGYSWCHSE